MYVLRNVGLLFNRGIEVYVQNNGHAPLRPEDFGQELLDYLTGEIKDGHLKRDDIHRLRIFPNGYQDDGIFDDFLAYSDEFFYPISQGNMRLEISECGMVAVSTSTGIKFRKDGRAL